MSTDDLRTVIATFRSVFPHAQLWALNQNDFLLLGSPSRIEVGGKTVAQNFAHVTSDLKPIGIVDLYSVVSLYLLEDTDLDTFSAGAVFNTDSHPVLEFHAPRFIYANTSDENFAALTAVRKTVEPPSFVQQLTSTATGSNHRYKGGMYLTSDSFKDAIREFRLAIEADTNDSEAWAGLLKAARSVAERPDVKKFIEDLLNRHPVTTVQTSAAEFYAQESAYDNAISLLQQVLAREPKNIKAWETLVDVQSERAGPDLATAVEKLLALEPENAKALYNVATVRFYEQRFDEAIQLVKRSLANDSTNPRARNLLAIADGQTFQHDLADAEFRKTIQDFPNDVLSLNNYGLYLLDRGRIAEAMVQFRNAVDRNPEDVQAFVGLGEAARQSGQPKEADRWYRIALRLDPNQPVAKMHVR
jgi:Tfp pilus assembly protein PilF